MNPLKTNGLILRTADSKNSSQVLTVLTPDLGKIHVWARGVRSHKNPMHAGAGLFCYSELVLLPRPGMYTLTGCTLLHSYYYLREDVERLSYAIYFAELAGIVIKEGMEADAPLRLLLNCLHYLEKGKKDPADLKMLYELRLLSLIGLRPHTKNCIRCGSKEIVAFSVADGGTLCAACGGTSLSRADLAVLQGYVEGGLRAALEFNGERQVPILAPLAEEFVRYHIETELKSLEYLNRIRNIVNKNGHAGAVAPKK